MNNIRKNISATLQNYMRENNFTQEEFAEELGIGRSSLQEYLKEDANPRADTIELLAKRLGISPSELISADAQKFPEIGEQKVHPDIMPLFDCCNALFKESKRLSDKLNAQAREKEMV